MSVHQWIRETCFGLIPLFCPEMLLRGEGKLNENSVSHCTHCHEKNRLFFFCDSCNSFSIVSVLFSITEEGEAHLLCAEWVCNKTPLLSGTCICEMTMLVNVRYWQNYLCTWNCALCKYNHIPSMVPVSLFCKSSWWWVWWGSRNSYKSS